MKKQLSLLLAVSMLASMSACGQTVSDVSEQTDAVSDTTAETTAETKLVADVPDKDYNGYTFRVLARGTKSSWGNYDISTDSANGEVINDAVFKRNGIIEEKFNVKIVHEKIDGYDVTTPTTKAILSGSDEYDIVMPSITDAGKLAQEGYFVPLQDMPYMDLTKPYYDQNCLTELAIKGKNYMFFSDITIRNLDAIWIYYFNKQMIDDFKLDDPYELVLSGKWTMDKLTEMCKSVTYDVNGDNAMNKSDRWGLVAHDYVITAAYVGSGERIATDKGGKIELTMNNERIYDVIDSLISLEKYWIRYSLTAKKFSSAAPVGFEPGDNYAELIGVFRENNALFMGEVMGGMEDMRDSDVEFGIVPNPKLEESQDSYHAAVNYIAAVSCIPVAATDLERTSIITEALACESHYTVIPAYYEIAMKSKYARDTISGDMLDMILGSRSYDLAIYYGWGSLSDRFCSLVYEGSTDFSSMYESNKSAAQDAINTFLAEK